MSVPVQIEPFLQFLGTEEGITHIVNPQLFSPSGSQNVFMDKLGRVKRIDGYAKKNSSAVTTNTGGTATRVNHLFGYKSISAGVVTRQVIGVFDDATDEWEIWYSADAGATWTFIADMGSSSDGQLADMAQYQNSLFITNGVIAPRKWDGTTLTTAGATQSPTPTALVSATAGPQNGNYRYKLVSVDNTGFKSPGSVSSNIESAALKKIDLSWTADADTDVVGYEVYRTTGTGNLFYYVGWVEGRTTVAYSDTASDLAILENPSIAEHGEAPPVGTYYCEVHGDRMWYFKTDTNPQRAYYSDLGKPESVGLFNFMNFADPEQFTAPIMGAMGNVNKKLVVWTDTSVWTVSGTGQVVGNLVDWSKKRSNAGAGAISHRVMVRVPVGAIYRDSQGNAQVTNKVMIAYMTPQKDIRLFDGDGDTIISFPVRDSLALLNLSGRLNCHAYHDEVRGEIVWFYPHDTASAGIPDRAVAWNYRIGTWYRRFPMSFMSSAVVDAGAEAVSILAGAGTAAVGGHVFTLWSGNSFNGAAIDARWMSGTLYGRLGEDTVGRETSQPAAPFTKRYRWLDLLATSVSGVTLTVEWFNGHAPDGATAIGSKTFTPSDTSLETSQRRVRLQDSAGAYLHDEGLRVRVGNSSASTNAWGIDGFYAGFQILPGLYRRNQ